MSIIILQVGDC